MNADQASAHPDLFICQEIAPANLILPRTSATPDQTRPPNEGMVVQFQKASWF